MKRIILLLVATIVTGCATYASINYDQLFGVESVQEREVPHDFAQSKYFLDTVKPVIDNRCVVCHACYDAPCQLKMSSTAGLDRGASKHLVYQGARLTATNPTRLFEDAESTQEWRDFGFTPVLNERVQHAQANIEAGLMAQMLLQKEEFPLAKTDQLEGFDFSINRTQVCPTIDEYAEYRAEYPNWGMPYGLPAISKNEQEILLAWIRQGASMPETKPLTEYEVEQINLYENYLNRESLKSQLIARYIYEHLFISHLYFEQAEPNVQPRFFTLVRSSTPPGEAVKRIVTRRPYEDPQVERVYYRLIPEQATIVDKTHMPYSLTDKRLEDWKLWFDTTNFEVKQLPSYQAEVASNPMLSFVDIPIQSKYNFLLDDVQNTIMAFIKGPVCRGQIALNVINDHFWVYFSDPNLAGGEAATQFFIEQAPNMKLPAEVDSSATSLINWRKFSKAQSKYLAAKLDFMNNYFKDGEHLDEGLVWDGGVENKNAALTIFRHFDSATVVEGLVGNKPKTAWVIDYSLLERIHYLLVAGFDIYGNYGHQLVTRMYMDLLRLEGEANFTALLPADKRNEIHASWYENSPDDLAIFMGKNAEPFTQPSNIQFMTDDVKNELLSILSDRVNDTYGTRYKIIDTSLSDQSESTLENINQISGIGISHLPQIIMIKVRSSSGQDSIFTLLKNNAHSNISSIFLEDTNRLPENDSLTLVKGVLGSYPAAFLSLNESEIPLLYSKLVSMQSEEDYVHLLDRFAVRRSSDQFWTFSDELHAWYKADQVIEFGLLDYNRFENR